jgi:hypothetical protein
MISSHEKRVNALMRLHGMSKSEAEKRAKQIEKTKTNPVRRKNTSVHRLSQATKKKPSKRLVARRIKNLKMPEGVFPNPVKRKVYAKPGRMDDLTKRYGRVYHVELSIDGEVWKDEGVFVSKESAFEYARALDRKHDRKYWIRVTT